MKKSRPVLGVVSSVLCISTVLNASSPPSEPFRVVVPSWSEGLLLRHCDFTIPDSLDSEILTPFTLCHAGVLAVQKSGNKAVTQQLLKDRLNVFFCSKNPKKFLVLHRERQKWQRTHLADLNGFVGKNARIFVPHLIG